MGSQSEVKSMPVPVVYCTYVWFACHAHPKAKYQAKMLIFLFFIFWEHLKENWNSVCSSEFFVGVSELLPDESDYPFQLVFSCMQYQS
jgi:hypothetical protein